MLLIQNLELACGGILATQTNAFSAKDGMHLTLKANVFGARDKLTCLAIELNAFGIGGERVWRWRRTLGFCEQEEST